MIRYLGIYFLILLAAIISGLIFKNKNEFKSKMFELPKFILIYYVVISFFRTIVGNGHQFLGVSFYEKNIISYFKAAILLIVVYIGIFFLNKIPKEYGQKLINRTVGFFAILHLLYIVVIDIPNMLEIVIMAIIAFGITILSWKFNWGKKSDYSKRDIMENLVLIMLFSTLFLITGPSELYIYNADDFVFSFGDFFPHMICYIFVLLTLSSAIVVTHVPKYLIHLLNYIIFTYSICSYIQQIFFNGKMSNLEGVEQRWNNFTSFGNLVLWILMIVLIAFVFIKLKNSEKIILIISSYIIAIQLVTFVTMMVTNLDEMGKNRQLVKDDAFVMSPNENIAIFILDAYDTQMMDMVLEDDPDYLNPLHDFTYFPNSHSRYYATGGSLPYLLTGRIYENEKEYVDIYKKSTFLKSIKNKEYEINLLTEEPYVKDFEEGIIQNYTEDYYCNLDFEKTVSQMSQCIRFRTMPFLMKKYYYYENYDITNIIRESNVYLFGTDANFYSDLMEEGIVVDDTRKHMFQMYHLYGAHSPYYLTADAKLDYNSNPLAQWKGSLKIVYDYIEKLKEKDIYDRTSIIIMADHGLNGSQRGAVMDWNIEITEESNPIFYVKQKNQKKDKLEISNKKISHDNFFATVLELIGEGNKEYPESVFK